MSIDDFEIDSSSPRATLIAIDGSANDRQGRALITDLFLTFRHADREVVLEHVKSHYRDDGTPQEKPPSSGMELAAPPPPLPIQMPFQIMNNLLNGHAGTSTTTANVHNRNLLTLGGGANQMQASNSNQASSTHQTIQTLNFNSQNTLTTPQSSHDVGKNNNGMPETNSTNSSLKGSFRCGHCGQISNWKHVIQVFTNSFPLPTSNMISISRIKPNPFDDNQMFRVNIRFIAFERFFCVLTLFRF